MSRATMIWIVLGWVGYAVLPWHIEQSTVGALVSGPGLVASSGLVLGITREWWLLPILLPLLATLYPLLGRGEAGRWLVGAGAAGLALLLLQGFAIGLGGFTSGFLASLFGAPGPSQGGVADSCAC